MTRLETGGCSYPELRPGEEEKDGCRSAWRRGAARGGARAAAADTAATPEAAQPLLAARSGQGAPGTELMRNSK